MLPLLVATGFSFLSGCEQKPTKATQPTAVISPPPSTQDNTILYRDSVYKIIGPAHHNVTLVRTHRQPFPLRPGVDTLFHDAAILVLGDTVLRGGRIDIYQKFIYRHAFADFPATAFRGPAAPPNFATNPEATWHRTRITEGAQQPANFAGHYRLVTWGCGSGCQVSVLVDQRSGRIDDVPETAKGLCYRADSRLLITDYANGEGEQGSYLINAAYPIPHYYLWTGRGFKQLD